MASSSKKHKKSTLPKKTSADKSAQMFTSFYARGEFESALKCVLAFLQRAPKNAEAWADAATTCIMLTRWAEAIKYANNALKLSPHHLAALDALAHAHCDLQQWEQAKYYGNLALSIRDQRYAKPPVVSMPDEMNMDTSQWKRKVIAFSLFGNQAKYCECAILNCIERPNIYPDWECLFYVDSTVSSDVIERLQQHGGQVVRVSAQHEGWPGPMWRFLAYDLSDVGRVIFRDCDSIITSREAQAVNEWVLSGKKFHMMRDYGSHTELILAGLWGVCKGALPAMQDLITSFLQNPVESTHFADQFFLREYVWPYARQDIMQHDSIFGFLGGQAFPHTEREGNFHIGCNEATPYFEASVDAQDGAVITWQLIDTSVAPEQLVCAYPATVRNKKIGSHLPSRYSKRLNGGGMIIRLGPANTTEVPRSSVPSE